MKYNQFLELDKILNENDINVDNIKKDHEVLNEVGLGLIAGIVAGGLGLAFRKYLLRWGIKSFYLKKFKHIGEKFKDKTLENATNVAKKYAGFRQEIVQKEQSLKGKEGPEYDSEREALKQSKESYDRKISRDVLGFVTKVAGNKTSEIYERIDSLKRLKPHQKTALKGLWETIIIDIKIEAFQRLVKDGIVSDPILVGEFEDKYKVEKAAVKTKLQKLKSAFEKDKNKETPADDTSDTVTPSPEQTENTYFDETIEGIDDLKAEVQDRTVIQERIRKTLKEAKTKLAPNDVKKVKEKIVNTFDFIKFKVKQPVEQSALKKVEL